MPLTQYLKERAFFDPEAVEALNTTLTAVRGSLQLTGQDDPMAQIVARTVIDVARLGECDPKRLHDLALVALKKSGRRSA